MRMEIEAIKEGLKSLPGSFWEFIKKVLVFCFLYGRMCIVPAMLSLGLMWLLKELGVSLDICKTVMKLGLIIGQIIPAASYAGVLKDDPNVEASIDVCFSGWIIISILIWYNL